MCLEQNFLMQNPQVDRYLIEGCGRCELHNTPACKVNTWRDVLITLRGILNETTLIEERKWGNPCYTHSGKNILMLSALKNYASIGFFKGVLLKDMKKYLEAPGEHSQSVRVWRFTSIDDVLLVASDIKDYVAEAIELEQKGSKVAFKKVSADDYPQELKDAFNEDPTLASAFNALTPGRQRGYLLHFNGAKQSSTRRSRIEKCLPKIFEGKGLNER